MALRTTARRPQTARANATLPQTRALGRRSSLILLGSLLAYAVLGVGYAVATPIWENPDEPAHFNYVRQVAETSTLPELRPGDWDSELLYRVQNGLAQPDEIPRIRYESWQPPLAYIASAPAYLLGPRDPAAAVLRLRLWDVLLGAATLVVAHAAARLLLAGDLALAVPLTIAGIPMFTSVSASVSADPLANLLAALLFLVLLRQATRPVVSGALLGLGAVTKLALVIFVPLAVWRAPKKWLPMLALAAAITVPWLVHQVTTYGWSDPLALARHSQVVSDQPRFTGLTPQYLTDFLTISFHSFWAQFGWMAIRAGDRLYAFWGLVSLLAAVGLIVRRLPLREPHWQLVFATLAAAIAAYIVYNLAFTQFQGRYLFTALVPIAILLVRGWSSLLPSRWQSPGTFALAAVLVAVNAWALLRVLVPGFTPIS